MMEMIDMGHKMEEPTAVGEGKEKNKMSYPSFSITGDKIPDELKSAELETMCRCEIIIKKVGDDIDTYAEGQPRRIQLEIHKLGYIGKAGKVTKDEYLAKSPEERDTYDREQVGLNEKEEPDESSKKEEEE
jgi:hypothetical protein